LPMETDPVFRPARSALSPWWGMGSSKPADDGKRLAGFLGVALLITTLLNGAGPYLRRVGVLQASEYHAYWAAHCGPEGTTREPFGFGRRCAVTHKSVSRSEMSRRERGYSGYVRQVLPGEVSLKLAKDLLVLIVIGAGLVRVVHERGARASLNAVWPGTPLLTLILLSASVAALQYGSWLAAAGLRSFSFLPFAIAAVVLGLPRGIDRVGTATTMLLFAQLALVVPELLYGLPLGRELPFLNLPPRMAGTLVLPNTLGVFAVASFAFAVAFGGRHWRWASALAATILLASAAGSATGFLALLALFGSVALKRADATRRPALLAILVLAAILLVALLPVIVSRPDLFDSLWSSEGRLSRFDRAFSDHWLAALFGRGLGVATNTSVNLSLPLGKASPLDAGALGSADSTVTMLVAEMGLVGLALFYGMFLWAGWRDSVARAFYLVVLVASLTINVTEVFPVNLLLGLALAHSFTTPPRLRTASSDGHNDDEVRLS